LEHPQLSRKLPQRQTAEPVLLAREQVRSTRETGRPIQLQPPTGLQNRAQGNEEEDEDQDGFFRHHPGVMGIMERGHGHHGWFKAGAP